ncbi:hypothetical protein Nos7524_2692 [Nostoc sp. PCC 7524]|uniref:hypothetical protein n=1 Tax=Nostoc sp. (strain ATCC 29411 / PCC 7524) TaxID=28072 RepID=UPI00029EEEF5|nr:hypothetical protein [Nostoc sp. PCC 7524]AFY48525.1 hypothetical protein Nos7524_2692 [Nostoc sp. PCC 7524]
MNYIIRPLTQQDEPFLWQMLYEAAHMAAEGDLTVQDAMNHPELFPTAAPRRPEGRRWEECRGGDEHTPEPMSTARLTG